MKAGGTQGARDGLISPAEWHGWHLDPTTASLIFQHGDHHWYEVEANQMLDAADILFWIIQVFREDWSDQAFLGFVTEVDDVLNPQQTICAFRNGPNSMRPEEVPYTPETIRDRVRVFAAGEWLKRSAHRFAAEPPREPSGPNLEDRDWQKAVEVEPRLARLEEAVLAEAARRQANGTYNPDRLYYDTKPYLAALLGVKPRV